MNTLATIVGWLLLGSVACLVISYAFWLVVVAIMRLRAVEHGVVAREIGGRLWNDAWWFSEDPRTLSALQIIGSRLSRDGLYSVDEAREEWRKTRLPNKED